MAIILVLNATAIAGGSNSKKQSSIPARFTAFGGSMSQSIIKTLEDTDPMPFGKFKGKPMQDVPASYLHWLWTNGKSEDKLCPVADYIRRNIEALKKEYPDGLWL